MDPWQDIRRRARETRALLGVGYAGAPAQTVLDALLRHWDIALDLVAPEHPLLRGARAAWREEYGLVIVDGTLSPAERSFAVAHELGHRVCHPGGCLCEPADIDDEALPVALPLGEGRVWGYNPRQAREVEANVFAAELLAPAAGLRALFLAGSDYRTLADHYGVTATCALNGLAGAVLGGEPSPPASLPRLPRAGGVGEKSSPMYKDGPGLGEGLDESQRRAAETGAARALIDAGPGTGKTRTLVARVLRLLQTAGVPAHEILALTFSNRATDELRERLRAAGPETAGVVVSTFHGYALDALRRFAPQAGLPDGFRVVDDVDAAIMMEEAIPALDLKRYTHLARPALYLPAILQAAGRMRDLLLTREDLALVTRDTDAEEQEQEQEQGQGQGQERGDRDEDERAALDETLRLLASYDELLAARGLVDYGGLIARAVDLMQSSPAAAASLRGGIRHVLVDEYQDVNRASAVLLRELVAGGAHLWAVGDARQSIYRFRGAEPRNLADFEKDFPGGVRLSLERNYRATPALVDAIATVAARITGSRPAWQAWRDGAVDAAGYPGDGEVTLAVAPDGASEVAGIVDDIARSIATGRPPDEHAVLCRTHRQATNVAAALEAAGLPTSYLGSLFLRPEIKDLLAFLELCHGLDGSALLRLAMWPEYRLDRGRVVELVGAARERGAPFPAALGEAGVTSGLTVEERGRLGRLAAHVEAARYYPDPASVLLHYLFSDAPYLRRLLRDDSPSARQAAAAIFQLIVLARGFMARPLAGPADGATHAFLRYARRLLAEGEAAVSQAAAAVPGAVNLLTVHASKGLEFPVVYMPNLAQGRFPPRARGGVQVALPAALARDPRADAEEEHNLYLRRGEPCARPARAQPRRALRRARRAGVRSAGRDPRRRRTAGGNVAGRRGGRRCGRNAGSWAPRRVARGGRSGDQPRHRGHAALPVPALLSGGRPARRRRPARLSPVRPTAAGRHRHPARVARRRRMARLAGRGGKTVRGPMGGALARRRRPRRLVRRRGASGAASRLPRHRSPGEYTGGPIRPGAGRRPRRAPGERDDRRRGGDRRRDARHPGARDAAQRRRHRDRGRPLRRGGARPNHSRGRAAGAHPLSGQRRDPRRPGPGARPDQARPAPAHGARSVEARRVPLRAPRRRGVHALPARLRVPPLTRPILPSTPIRECQRTNQDSRRFRRSSR